MQRESERGHSADPAEVPYPNLHDRAGTDGEHCDQCNLTLMEHHMKELGDAGISLRWMIMEPENANCSYLMVSIPEVKMDRDMTLAYFNNETARIVIEKMRSGRCRSLVSKWLSREWKVRAE